MVTNAILKIFKNGESLEDKKIDGEVLLGRAEDCAIILDDHQISRHHVSFKLIEGGKSLQVEKKSDFAPVEINGVDVTTAIVKEGDIVVVGPYELRFQAGQSAGLNTLRSPEPDKAVEELIEQDPKQTSSEESDSNVMEVSEFTPLAGAVPPAEGPQSIHEATREISPEDLQKDLLDQPPSLDLPQLDFNEKNSEVSTESSGNGPSENLMIDDGNQKNESLDLFSSPPKPPQNAELPSQSNASGLDSGDANIPDIKLGDSPNIDLDHAPSEVNVEVNDAGEVEQSALLQNGSGQNESNSQKIERNSSSFESERSNSGSQSQLRKTNSAIKASASSGSIDTQARTRVGSQPRVRAALKLPQGASTQIEFEINKDELVLGRGKNCDVVLTDKKASRRHTAIRRQGVNFSVVDLESANGTFLNGVRINEQSLSGDDVIKIGDTEINFAVVSLDYEEKKNDFLSVPSEATGSFAGQAQKSRSFGLAQQSGAPQFPPQPYVPGQLATTNLSQTQSAIKGIPGGLPGAQPPGLTTQAQSLKEKWNALPPKRRIFLIVLVGAFLYLMLDEEPTIQTQQKPAEQTRDVAANKPGQPAVVRTFEKLSAEDKNTVKKAFEAAKVHFKAFNYDQCLFEVRKVFTYVDDYVLEGDSARDLEQFAMEGKRRLDANAEDQRRKAEEEDRKKRLVELETDTESLMEAKQYEQAKALFSDIIALDPENSKVERWKQIIEEFYDSKRQEEITKQRQKEINDNAQVILTKAQELKSQGQCLGALDKAFSIRALIVTDKKISRGATAIINDCKKEIEQKITPLLLEAKAAEEMGDVVNAYKGYKKAAEIDPRDARGFEGMERIKSQLHEKAKIAYTEAVIAESYSDFDLAKKKYRECIEIAPEGDIYLERAKRKLARFGNFEGGTVGPSSGEEGT